MLWEDISGSLLSKHLPHGTTCRLGLISVALRTFIWYNVDLLGEWQAARTWKREVSNPNLMKAQLWHFSPQVPSLPPEWTVLMRGEKKRKEKEKNKTNPFYHTTICQYNQTDFQLGVQSLACKHFSAGNRVGCSCLFFHHVNLFGNVCNNTWDLNAVKTSNSTLCHTFK